MFLPPCSHNIYKCINHFAVSGMCSWSSWLFKRIQRPFKASSTDLQGTVGGRNMGRGLGVQRRLLCKCYSLQWMGLWLNEDRTQTTRINIACSK
jgi:hypothetical protein